MTRFSCLLIAGVASCLGLTASSASAFEPQLGEYGAARRTAAVQPIGYWGAGIGLGFQAAPAPVRYAPAPVRYVPMGLGGVAPCASGFCGTPAPRPVGCLGCASCQCPQCTADACVGGSCAPLPPAGIWQGTDCTQPGCVVPQVAPAPAPGYYDRPYGSSHYRPSSHGHRGHYGTGTVRPYPYLP